MTKCEFVENKKDQLETRMTSIQIYHSTNNNVLPILWRPNKIQFFYFYFLASKCWCFFMTDSHFYFFFVCYLWWSGSNKFEEIKQSYENIICPFLGTVQYSYCFCLMFYIISLVVLTSINANNDPKANRPVDVKLTTPKSDRRQKH